MGRPKSSSRAFVDEAEVMQVQRVPQLTRLPPEPWTSTSIEITAECQTCRHVWKLPVQISKTRQGLRFICPRCQRKVQKLYIPVNVAKNDWACLRCHRLVYRSQYEKSRSGKFLTTFGMLQGPARKGTE